MKYLLFSIFAQVSISLFAQFSKIDQLKSANPREQDYFGDAIDTYENYLVLTSVHGENDSAYQGGFVGLYKSESGKITHLSNMLPTTSRSKDRLGQDALAIYKNQVVVGDWMNTKQSYGAAFVFEFDENGNWNQKQILTVNPYDDVNSFGRRVDIEKEVIVVSGSSAVFIFLNKNDNYQLVQTITKKNEGFGSEVLLKDDFLFVSSPYKDDGGFENCGSVYIYEQTSNGQFKFKQEILGSTQQQKGLEYGQSLAYSKGKLYVGAPSKNMGKFSAAGSVDIYELKDGKFTFLKELYAYDMGFNEYRFGEKIQVSDEFLVVGHAQNEDHKGSVYTYQIIENDYKPLWRINSPVSSAYGSDFGQNGIGIIGRSIFVGAPGDDFCSTDKEWGRGGCGSVLVYDVNVPVSSEVKTYTVENISDPTIKKTLKKLGGDLIVHDYINEDGVYKMRSKSTKKWGLFQFEKEILPMEYDSLEFFDWNAPITRVMKDGKWGIVAAESSDFTGVPCVYDEVKILTFEGRYFVAAKKEANWLWVDWQTGQEKPEPKFKYYQELLIPQEWLKK